MGITNDRLTIADAEITGKRFDTEGTKAMGRGLVLTAHCSIQSNSGSSTNGITTASE
jgi:hypothetical protein